MKNVLSLFDGMSCLQIALNEMNMRFEIYYSSEIDKHAIKQTQLNFPETIQLGDITKWETWSIDWSTIDLIGAGSPCQGFSFAGKQLAFDDPRSKLFFVFIDILNHCRKFNPHVKFLFENVNMKREHMVIINEFCGVFPVNINSNLVSAQNRDRWYWSNIKTRYFGLFNEIYTDIPKPKDAKLFICNILESNVSKKYYYSEEAIQWIKKHEQQKNKTLYVFDEKDKFPCLEATMYKKYSSQRFWAIKDQFDQLRYITPTECARLQTIPEWYKWQCSDTQQYRMLGNGWTINVIIHILSFLSTNNQQKSQ